MKEYENKVKKKMNDMLRKNSEPTKELYSKVAKDINLENKEKSGFSFKKWMPALATTFCLVVALILGIIFINPNKVTNYNSIIQLDVNPSIQLVVNQDNKVLSVTGLNDDGKMVLQGEVIVGKTYDEAIELIISLETQMGYLKEGTNNKVTVTVSAEDKKVVENLEKKSEEFINEALEKSGIKATIEKAKGQTKEELKKLAKELDPTLTEEEINNLNYDQLVNVVKAYHIETVEYASVKLEEFYKNFKAYEVSFTEKEAVKEAVDGLGGLTQISFDFAYQMLSDAYQLLQDGYYSAFIDQESEYQKQWVKLTNLKNEYLAQSSKVDAMKDTATPEELLVETNKLNQMVAEYTIASNVLNEIEAHQVEIYKSLCNAFEVALASLEEAQATLPNEVKEITFKTLYATEEALNTFKSNLCADFEAKYKDDIIAAQEQMKARKQELIDSLNAK